MERSQSQVGHTIDWERRLKKLLRYGIDTNKCI
jgi:hypothetical protein